MQRADTSAFTKAPQLLQMHPLREVFKLKQKQKNKKQNVFGQIEPILEPILADSFIFLLG